MKALLFVCLALLILLAFLFSLFLILKSMNELDKYDCGDCDKYDSSLHTCWLRFEERFPGDKACDQFDFADKDKHCGDNT